MVDESNLTVMTPKTDEDRVRLWHDRISVAENYKRRIAKEKRWQDFIDEYNGHYDVKLADIYVPPINEVFGYTQAFISFVSFKDPHLSVVAKKTGTVQGARILSSALNYWWRELKMNVEMDSSLLDAILVGHGWNKVGYKKLGLPKDEPLKDDDLKLYSNRVSWRDILTNINSERPPEDAQWVAQRMIRPLVDIKEAYPNAKDMKGTFSPLLHPEERKRSMFKDDIMVGELWEVWDQRERKIYLLGTGVDKFLKKTDWPDYLDEYPYQKLWFNQTPDEPFPVSQIAPWEPQILERIKLMAMALNHAKRWNRQMLAKGKVIEDEDLDKFERGVDGGIIKHKSQNIRNDVMLLDFGPASTDFFVLLDRLKAEENSINALPDIVRGGVTRTQTRTKGELDLVVQGSQSVVHKKVTSIERYITDIARNMMAHMQANFDVPQIIKITGDSPLEILKAFGDRFNPATGEITFNKDDITGEYDVEVKPGSTLPQDKEGKLAVLNAILRNLGQAATQGISSPFFQEVVTEQLAEYDVKGLQLAFEKEKELSQQRQAQSGKTQAIENAERAMRAEKAKAQADKLDSEAQKTDIEAQNEQRSGQVEIIEKMYPPEETRDLQG